ncbi:metaxin-2-like isoform X2 [Pomacea canaliculata]|uniref:metaxin-2-like isoform X2 n=1 Tax=Pomacea canaliculata TaxID=400727 RepID=UPI000D72C2C1|nr:metaxin-2-like isoform X2 [Pomacea canaliculata]
MASPLVVDEFRAELGAEPWPDGVTLYQQYQAEQITFPDSANCLSVKAFLYMCGLNFQVELKTNAEEMSPSGKVPFIHVGAFLVSELDPIIAFVNAKGFALTSHLSDIERSEMRAYMAMIDNILVNAELYLAWLDETVSSEVTRPRYGCPYPWPLNWILPLRKQSEVRARLSSNGWKDKNMKQVCEEVRICCQALSERLDQQQYFFGDKPTELDALVFGHLYTLITTELPVGQFADIIQQFSNLTNFCKHIEEEYFKD